MTIKKWIVITINTLLIFVVTVVSFSFYLQFKSTLDERVLLQLTSVRELKKNQIEEFFKREWREFLNAEEDENTVVSTEILSKLQHDRKYKTTGVYDVTHLDPKGTMLIAFVEKVGDSLNIKLLGGAHIQKIVLERTGLGKSGETYLVGEDFKLRSKSRFFPDKPPYTIVANTKGVKAVFEGKSGSDIYKDYRGLEVYSSYQEIRFSNINWVILSEIDEEEVMIPLYKTQKRLFFIAFIVVLMGVMISLYLAKVLSKPIVEMQNKLQAMSGGDYQVTIENSNGLVEIKSMFIALTELQNSLKGAVKFSSKIENMDLESSYKPTSSKDLLGKSLIKMRNSLISFRDKEALYNSSMKKMLIDREEAERKRISMELHDGIGPLLTTLKMYVQNNIQDKKTKEEIKKILDSTITETRNITYALIPPTLLDFGIGTTLKSFLERLQKNDNIEIRFDDDTLGSETKMSHNLQINIFRICQELINNTLKHAEANTIIFTLSEFEDYVSLFYFDDGKGYDKNKIVSGAGLTNIQERVEIFKGKIEMHSEKNKTTVEIEIPIQNGTN